MVTDAALIAEDYSSASRDTSVTFQGLWGILSHLNTAASSEDLLRSGPKISPERAKKSSLSSVRLLSYSVFIQRKLTPPTQVLGWDDKENVSLQMLASCWGRYKRALVCLPTLKNFDGQDPQCGPWS